MLNFIKGPSNRGKIIFESDSRRQFDLIRQHFKTQNKDAKYSKYNYAASPWTYMITPLGAYNLGHTDDLINFCKKNNIQYTIDDKLNKITHPKLHISQLEDLPNPNYIYRDYQETLIKSLANNGRGVIISPTRSGKSLILAGLFHNTLLHSKENGIQNILLIVPNLLLVEQFCNDLNDYYSIKEETIIVTLANNKKIELDGEDEIETTRGLIKAKDLKKSDDILSIPF